MLVAGWVVCVMLNGSAEMAVAPAGSSLPMLATPVPFRVRLSAAVVMPPWICSAAPLATVVPVAVAPRAVALLMFRAPTLMVVAPL